MNKKPVSYKQTDPRWKDVPYQTTGETATIGGSGCGPTCAAMLIETLTGKTFTPEDACKWSVERGYKATNQGTYYSYFTHQFAVFGLKCGRINEANLYGHPTWSPHQEAIDKLMEGYYIIACMGKGLWTSSGHFVVVWWIDDETVYILDPASDKPERIRGDVETFLREVKYYWWVDAREHNREDDMSYEKWKRHMERYRKELAEKPASEWAEEGLTDAVERGITDGLRPQDLATRQEVALMVRAAAPADGFCEECRIE